jgi:hypothetical protein
MVTQKSLLSRTQHHERPAASPQITPLMRRSISMKTLPGAINRLVAANLVIAAITMTQP